MSALALCLTLFCSYERTNPVDPESPDYIGDARANDGISPQLVVSSPAVEMSSIDFDSVVVAGTVYDLESGVAAVTVNGQSAIFDSTRVQGVAQYQLVFWHATVYLHSDTTLLTISATDNSVGGNPSELTRTVVQIRFPRTPANVTAAMSGQNVLVSWDDVSLNEEQFVVQRRTGTDTFGDVGTANANDTSFLDSGPFTANTAYYYRVVASNSAGPSSPSSATVIVYSATASDVDGPLITFTSLVDSETVNNDTVVAQLTVTDASGVQAGSVKVNGVAAAFSGGSWSAAVPLAHGEYNLLVAEARDNSANHNLSLDTIALWCDTSATDAKGPALTPVFPAQNATVSGRLQTVTVTATDLSGVAWVRLNGTQMTAGTGDQYTLADVVLTSGANALQITAEDVAGNGSSLTLNVTYDSSAVDNVPPQLAVTDPQNNSSFQTAQVTVTGTVSDNSGIQKVQIGSVAASVNGTNWTAVLTLSHGFNVLPIAATDNSPAHNAVYDTLTVIYNLPPVISGQGTPNGQLGSEYVTTLGVADPDADDIYVEKLGAPTADVNVSVNAGVITVSGWAPGAAGSYAFTVRAYDGFGGSDTVSWSVSVGGAGNNAPYYDSLWDTLRASVGQMYDIPLNAEDLDADPLTYWAKRAPASMSVPAAGGLFTWIPDAVDVGLHNVEMWVSDGQDSVYQLLTIVVAANQAPQVSVDIATANVKVDSMLFATFSGSDPENNSINYDWFWADPVTSNSPTLTYVDPNGWDMEWLAAQGDVGTHTFYFVFKDGGSPSMFDTVSMVVTVDQPQNSKPRIVGIPGTFVESGMQYYVELFVQDADGDAFAVDSLELPQLASYNTTASSIILDWVPTAAEEGNHLFYVSISDGKGGSDTLSWVVTVAATTPWSLLTDDLATQGTAVTCMSVYQTDQLLVGTSTKGAWLFSGSMQMFGQGVLPTYVTGILWNSTTQHCYVGGSSGGNSGLWHAMQPTDSWSGCSGINNTQGRDILEVGNYTYVRLVGTGSPGIRRTQSVYSFLDVTGDLPTSIVNALTASPTQGDLYCTIGGDIYSSTSGGGTWNLRKSIAEDIFELAYERTSSNLYLGTGTGLHVMHSDNGTEKYHALPSKAVTALYANTSSLALVVAAFADSTVSYSTDYGTSWKLTGSAPQAHGRAITADDNGIVYVGFQDGRIWTFMPE